MVGPCRCWPVERGKGFFGRPVVAAFPLGSLGPSAALRATVVGGVAGFVVVAAMWNVAGVHPHPSLPPSRGKGFLVGDLGDYYYFFAVVAGEV